MVQATNFLLRWLFLNNLIHERAELQSLPQIYPDWQHEYLQENFNEPSRTNLTPPPHHARSAAQAQVQHNVDGNLIYEQHKYGPEYQHMHNPLHNHGHKEYSSPQNTPNEIVNRSCDDSQQQPQNQEIDERSWRRKALHAIRLYPPGSLRLLALDSLRLEIVHDFARELHRADEALQKFTSSSLRNRISNTSEDRRIGADERILNDFRKSTLIDLTADIGDNRGSDKVDYNEDADNAKSPTFFSNSKNGKDNIINLSPEDSTSSYSRNENKISHGTKHTSNTAPSLHSISTTDIDLEPQTQAALALHHETRDYLPQLVSAILHSPAPLTQSTTLTSHLNPLVTLRRLLLTRCARDPNLGIELCWLLEAEVGKTWKRLFEHRQQTGRRLIVVLPADKAAVIRQIGSEKRSAFDLLQDVESATAYGVYGNDFYNAPTGEHINSMGDAKSNDKDSESQESSGLYSTPRLPAHLSSKRCSHFGDTMHFIDRLSQLSLDLKRISTHHREHFLQDSLEELNRRLRRRMVSKGNVSIDVEDNRGPYDWPTSGDISPDSLKYSIHFPLEPTSTFWPGGFDDIPGLEQINSHSPLLELKTKHGLMKVLNIVSSKSRILASRERCPYLVHCEVIETGLGGRDARLYLANSEDAGVTLNEAMGMVACRKRQPSSSTKPGGFASYRIPTELSPSNNREPKDIIEDGYGLDLNKMKATVMPRGGGEQDGHFYSNNDESGYFPTPYDLVRDEQLQQLHEHLQEHQQHPHYGPPQPPTVPLQPQHNVPMLTTFSMLLDRVFGIPWAETCEEIRQTSPYGGVKGWRLASFIMKAGEDIRREALVMQVISKIKCWFDNEIPMENRPYLKPYTIMCVGADAGLLECLRDAKSIDEVKKSTDGFTTLREYFERAFGAPSSQTYHQPLSDPHGYQTQSHLRQTNNPYNRANIRKGLSFEKAQDNFLRSLVGYSLVCYILQIKDRHNANILLDREGHIMHIDFGFVLGDTPKMGKVPLFSERAPFKLTAEFWDVLGGWNYNEGGLGVRFCKMFEEAFACASSHRDELVSLIEAAVLNLTRNPHTARLLANGVRDRLRMRGPRDSAQQKTFIMDLVNTALTSWGTSTYDWLQKSMNGYI